MNRSTSISIGALLSVSAISLAGADVLYKSTKLPDTPNRTIVDLNNSTQILTMRETPAGMKEIVIEDWSGGGAHYSETRPTMPAGEAVAATAFNDALQIVGYGNAGSGPTRAFLYGNGVFTYLDTTPPIRSSGGDNPASVANGINNLGDAAGSYRNDVTPTLSGFLYSQGTGSELTGFPSGSHDVSTIGINNLGQVAGSYLDSSGSNRAYLNDHGVVTDAGALTSAYDVNDRGEVFGQAYGGPHSQSCFILRNGQRSGFGGFGIGATLYCEPHRINNLGIAVGYVSQSGGPPNQVSSGPFVYDNGKLSNLNDLISPSDHLKINNIQLSNALFINDRNEIIATAKPTPDVTEYYLLTPIAAGTDTAQYNFETDAQGWASTGESIITVSTSAAQKFAGASALSVQFSSNGFASVAVSSPPVHSGQKITFHVYVPTDAHLDWIQVFALEGEAGGWAWHGNWQSLSDLQLGQWNTLTIDVPSEAQAIQSIGVEFFASAISNDTVYVDSVAVTDTP